VASDNHILGQLVQNMQQLDSVNKIVIKDLQKLVANGENRYNLEKEKNSYYIDMIELERKKRIKQGFIAGGLIILAILL
jgi:flagellar basal body rod protein FlgG